MSGYRTTVIIPAYNAEFYLARTVKSVLEQTDKDFQLIIIDDGSRDRTFEVAEGLAKLDNRILVMRQENGGVSSARNRGISLMDPESKYTAFLDADDMWSPEFLSYQIQAIESAAEFVAGHCLAKFIDKDDNLIKEGECEAMCMPRPTLVGKAVRNLLPIEPTTLSSFVVSGCIAAPGAVLFRSEIVRSVGGFDINFQVCADWEFYIRVARHGSFSFLDRALLMYRQHGSNMSGNVQKQQEEKRRVLAGALKSSLNSTEAQKLIVNSFRAAQLFYFKDKLKQATDALKKFQLVYALKQLAYGVKHIGRFISLNP